MARRISIETRWLVIQLRPNPYFMAGPYELAIDRDGFRLFGRRRHFGWSRGVGFNGARY